MTALAPAAGVLHRPADDPVRRQPAHHRLLPRHLQAAARLHPPADRQTPRPAGPDRPGRRHHRRLPATPGNGPRQQHRHPQHPPGRDPLAVSLRQPAGTRTRQPDRPGAGHPDQTHHHHDRDLPRPAPNSTRCSPRPTNPPGTAAATTPCSSSPRRPGCGSRELTGARRRRRPPRHRRARLLPRQRPQRPLHPADRPHRQVLHRLARPNADASRHRPAVLHPARHALSHDAVARLITKHAATAAAAPAHPCRPRTSHRTPCGTPRR